MTKSAEIAKPVESGRGIKRLYTDGSSASGGVWPCLGKLASVSVVQPTARQAAGGLRLRAVWIEGPSSNSTPSLP